MKGRFKTKHEGYQQRIRVYACSRPSCDWYTTEGKVHCCGRCGETNCDYFDSWAEFLRWRQLQLLERGGHITDLQLHPRFPITVLDVCGNPKVGTTYVGDFSYKDNDTPVIEDVKPSLRENSWSEIFILKKHLMKIAYNIDILITTGA